MKSPLLKRKNRMPRLLLSLSPYLKQKRTLVVFSLVALILIIAALLSFLGTEDSDILPYRQNVEVLPFQGSLHVAINDKLLNPLIHAEKCQKFSSSLDGTIAAFLTDTKELYLVQDHTLRKIADDVLHFEISASGQGVAFAQKYAQQNALTLYDLEEGIRREITTLLSRLDFSLSPDGKSLAYYTMQDEQEVLMCYRKGRSTVVSADKADLVGLSDDAKNIYAVCPTIAGTSILYSFNHKGNATALGSVTSISFKFNDDHRQIMFYDNGNTLVSTNGQAAVNASSYPLYLVTAPYSQSASDGNSITLPVTTLFDHVYTCSDGESTSAWLIRKDPQKSEKLVSRVSGCTLDASSEYLYFIYDQSQLCVMNISKGLSKILTLAENADTYAVTSDRNKVYFTHDGTLYSTNGKKGGSAKIIANDISVYNLVMGASDALYYLCDSNAYLCRNGREADCVAQSIKSIYSSSNNVVYLTGESEIYTAYSRKQPVKILGTD